MALHIQNLRNLSKTQGGDISNIDNPMKLVNASYIVPVISNSEGYVESIECEQIGRASMILGAGRKDKDSPVDLSAGIVLHKKQVILSIKMKKLQLYILIKKK